MKNDVDNWCAEKELQCGALENATKQLDHVIDQARHKHSQHRNKFKEAIDYLDQIFEDLKKECDTTNDQDGKERSSAVVGHHPTVNSQADAIRRPTVVHPNASKTSASTPKRTLRQVKPVQAQLSGAFRFFLLRGIDDGGVQQLFFSILRTSGSSGACVAGPATRALCKVLSVRRNGRRRAAVLSRKMPPTASAAATPAPSVQHLSVPSSSLGSDILLLETFR
ncbi:unnamed protein product [Heligmosomoides polygyrus]|uniref:MIT domain-containing protein n=1 Tax=Heligmosomoides polygyrus TaxID=6339 RepID=A0A3P7ZN70_HELPZ|nr:unnamed protein product [Heligmosomoides polygyrus]